MNAQKFDQWSPDMTKEEALAVLTNGADSIGAKLETLLNRFSDGANNTQSIYHDAANAYVRHMADEVWDAVNGVVL